MSIAQGDRMADALNRLGLTYSQPQRWAYIDRSPFLKAAAIHDVTAMIAALKRGGRADCSSSCGAILAAVCPGVDLTGTFYTGNFNARAYAAGCDILKYSGLGGVRHGDFLNSPGHHVVYKRGKGKRGKYWSAESRVGYRTYTYPSVWDGRRTYVVRPRSTRTWMARVLAAHANGASEARALGVLRLRLPWDGPRWSAFMRAWAVLDKGMRLAYTADQLTDVPGSGHAFVVLGSSISHMTDRLTVGLPAILAHPASRVLVTGAKDRAGLTEAAWMRRWLLAHGVDDARIIVEPEANSTIGNALYSVPELRAAGITTYTLVSDASHLRRAQVDFLAAQLQLETAENVGIELTALTALAHDDYAPAPVRTALPVGAQTRRTIAAEVAMVLGISEQYKAA